MKSQQSSAWFAKWSFYDGRLHFGAPWLGYSLAFALVVVAGVARLASGQHRMFAPFLLFYPVVATSSFFGGIGPGLFSILSSAIFVASAFPPISTKTPWIFFAIIGLLLASAFARFRNIRERSVALELEYARFRLISDYASDWIFLVEGSLVEGSLVEGDSTQFERIRFVNQTACIHLGWSAEELTGQLLSTLVRAGEAERLRELLMKTRQSASQPAVFHFQRRDASEAQVEIACAAVRTEGELVIHVIVRDVSERVLSEQRLREAQHWESLGALAGGLAHDFNNLLTAIVGNTSLARELLPKDHATIPLLDNALEAGERTAELVRLMLASSGYSARQAQEVRLDQILQDLLESGKLPPNVSMTTTKEPVRFHCDVRSIQTLLANLLMNAAEAYPQTDRSAGEGKSEPVSVIVGPPAKGTIQAWHGHRAAGQATFEEGREPNGEVLSIVVEDWGSGMTQDILDRAFQPFYSTKFAGRGLGLAAVRGIVRSCGGKIRLQTAPGMGTKVEVHLPLQQTARPAPAPGPEVA